MALQSSPSTLPSPYHPFPMNQSTSKSTSLSNLSNFTPPYSELTLFLGLTVIAVSAYIYQNFHFRIEPRRSSRRRHHQEPPRSHSLKPSPPSPPPPTTLLPHVKDPPPSPDDVRFIDHAGVAHFVDHAPSQNAPSPNPPASLLLLETRLLQHLDAVKSTTASQVLGAEARCQAKLDSLQAKLDSLQAKLNSLQTELHAQTEHHQALHHQVEELAAVVQGLTQGQTNSQAQGEAHSEAELEMETPSPNPSNSIPTTSHNDHHADEYVDPPPRRFFSDQSSPTLRQGRRGTLRFPPSAERIEEMRRQLGSAGPGPFTWPPLGLEMVQQAGLVAQNRRRKVGREEVREV